MKLKGILSSKGRREVFERNQSSKAPTDPMLSGHNPIAESNGSLKCSGCTGTFSPAAFARHLTGASMLYADHGIYITGVNDPWTEQQNTRQGVEVPDRETREALIDAHYKDRKHAPYVAEGVDRSITD